MVERHFLRCAFPPSTGEALPGSPSRLGDYAHVAQPRVVRFARKSPSNATWYPLPSAGLAPSADHAPRDSLAQTADLVASADHAPSADRVPSAGLVPSAGQTAPAARAPWDDRVRPDAPEAYVDPVPLEPLIRVLASRLARTAVLVDDLGRQARCLVAS